MFVDDIKQLDATLASNATKRESLDAEDAILNEKRTRLLAILTPEEEAEYAGP